MTPFGSWHDQDFHNWLRQLEAAAPEHHPDCTCTRCDRDFFEDEMCDGCGYCYHCCTCKLAQPHPDPDGSDDDDRSGECPYWDDDPRASRWHAAHTRMSRFEAALASGGW